MKAVTYKKTKLGKHYSNAGIQLCSLAYENGLKKKQVYCWCIMTNSIMLSN